MKCRKSINGNIVWFGKTSETSEIISNYSTATDAVIDSLIQRLSIIKGELWYQVNYGLPITEKYKSKGIFDAIITDIISGHPGVKYIKSYSSTVEKSVYTFNSFIVSIYGDEFELKNSYAV